jgi:L-alanine-DL-glutamate epimerase-like enolase superfamily enzyme
MAEAWHLPCAPHDCTGPVVFIASTHLSLNATNALIQESLRGYYKSWYGEVVTAIPIIENGFVTVPDGPGLGCDLSPDIDQLFSVRRRVSE